MMAAMVMAMVVARCKVSLAGVSEDVRNGGGDCDEYGARQGATNYYGGDADNADVRQRERG